VPQVRGGSDTKREGERVKIADRKGEREREERMGREVCRTATRNGERGRAKEEAEGGVNPPSDLHPPPTRINA